MMSVFLIVSSVKETLLRPRALMMLRQSEWKGNVIAAKTRQLNIGTAGSHLSVRTRETNGSMSAMSPNMTGNVSSAVMRKIFRM